MFRNAMVDDTRATNLMGLLGALITAALLAAVVLAISPAAAQQPADAGIVEAAPIEEQPIIEAPAPPETVYASEGVFDDHVVFDGTAEDLFAGGQTVSVTGVVMDNAFMFGKTMGLDGGRVEGDLFLAGAEATVDGEVLGDIYGFAGKVHITPDAVIHGDVSIGAGDLRHEGTILGNLDAGVGSARIEGTVAGDAELQVGELLLGPNADIGGDLDYEAPHAADLPDGMTVGGEVLFTEVQPDADEKAPTALGFLLKRAWLYIGALIAGCVLLWLGGPTVRRFGEALTTHPGRSMGFGFATLVLVPAAAIVAMLLVLPLQLGVLTMVLYLISLYVSVLIASHAIGDLLLRRALGRTAPSAYAALAIGLLLLHVLLPIPYVGFLVRLVAIVAGLGSMWVAIRNGHTTPETA